MIRKSLGFLLLMTGLGAVLLPGAARARGCAAVAYWDWHLQGEALNLPPYVPYIGDHWNNQISSIEIHQGIWRFYIDANFQGDTIELGPGIYSWQNGNEWNDSISSFQCVQPTR